MNLLEIKDFFKKNGYVVKRIETEKSALDYDIQRFSKSFPELFKIMKPIIENQKQKYYDEKDFVNMEVFDKKLYDLIINNKDKAKSSLASRYYSSVSAEMGSELNSTYEDFVEFWICTHEVKVTDTNIIPLKKPNNKLSNNAMLELNNNWIANKGLDKTV